DALLGRPTERHRDRGTGGVAVFGNRHNELFEGDADAFADGLEDAFVGLVGHDPRDVVGRESVAAHGVLDLVGEGDHGAFENRAAVHLQIKILEVAAVGAGQQSAGAAAGTLDRLEHVGVAGEGHAVQAVSAGRAGEDGRAGAVAEEEGGLVVVGDGDAREQFGGDDDDFFGGAAADEGAADLKRVEPAGAGGVDVGGERARAAEELGQGAGHGGHRLVRDDGGEHDAVDFGGGDAGLPEGVVDGGGGEAGGGFAGVGVAAFLDAG